MMTVFKERVNNKPLWCWAMIKHTEKHYAFEMKAHMNYNQHSSDMLLYHCKSSAEISDFIIKGYLSL